MKNPNEEMLLTEEGAPIGEIVLADGTSQEVQDTRVADARRELVKAEAQDLTGSPDADPAVAELYPGYSDADRRKRALELFVAERRSIDDVAKAVDVPPRTVSMWAYNFHWDTLVRREMSAVQTQSVLELARLRSERRLEIVKEQLDQAKELREAALERVRSGETSVKSGTEAWAAAAKVEHTLTGVSEAGAVADVDGSQEESGKDQGQGGKQPLVLVINNGSASGIPVVGVPSR